MAGAKPGVHVVQLKTIQVPDSFVKGNKFIKWDDDSSVGTPVTLKVDPCGYILYWKDQLKETDCLDIALIRDTRTGKHARLPRRGHASMAHADPKVRDTITMGAQDIPLEEKMVTICYGTDMVNISFINFAANSKEVAKEWCQLLFRLATSLLAQNSSPLTFLEKCHTKLVHVTNQDGKIPVRNIVRMFAAHRDDKKKVEKALEAARLPAGKNDYLPSGKFTFEEFFSFYRHLVGRNEVDKIFHALGAKKKPYLSADQFVEFLNTQQRDPRLNEILYPFCDKKKAQSLIDQFEPNRHMAGKDSSVPEGHMSVEGFLRYLMSDENALLAPEKLDLSQDMNQPLSHYFINSSHNTYLTGHQLTGRSSVEIYREALLCGCRCVELDCWDGKGADEEPIITHGFTMCTEIVFKEVIEAIAESAFKVSDYPVILSFENHCSPRQQAKMAEHCRNILGDSLLTDPVDGCPLDPGVSLPSPALLRRKIVVKNKKRHLHKSKARAPRNTADGAKPGEEEEEEEEEQEEEGVEAEDADEGTPAVVAEEGGAAEEEEKAAADVELAKVEPEDGSSSESESDSDDEIGVNEDDDKQKGEVKKEKGTAGQEAEAGMEMSALVNYIQPGRFHSFEYAEKRNRSYECTSFVETQATNSLKEFPVEFVNFNKRQISRIYPKGTRVDSSNYMPQIFWNAGCQLVALNFQTLDLAMQLNLGLFEYNGRSGYILKPDFMRRKDRRFDPFAESPVDGIIAGTVEVRIISSQFLTDKKVGTYIEVDMYGLPADTVRKKFRTKVIPANAICPVYDEDPFVFQKVVLPELAILRISCCDENGKLLGHRVLPVEGLRPGYRHIGLRNELNQPLAMATLFVHITVKDYIPDGFADFALALSNPIAYQDQLEKHAEQLAVLEEDFDAPDEGEEIPETAGPVEFSRKNNASIISRKSGPETPGLSRVSSMQNKHLTKQVSSVSGISQGSADSGGNAPPPMSRMISSINAENGGLGQSVAASSRLNGPKCSSLPASPMHSVATTAENGAIKPPTTKIDVVQTTKLKDSDVIQAASMDTLKECKQYARLSLRVDKEVDALRRKHEKAKNSMQELHELQEEKLLLSQMKSKTSVEKTHRKSVKRASKHGNPSDMSVVTQKEMTSLVTDQESQHKDLKKQQQEAFMSLCKDQYQSELDLHLRWHAQLYDTLSQQVNVSLESQLKCLDEIHDKEVGELKKKLDLQNREEMKLLAKKHKDKNELARMKREAMQKHITMAVQEREKLRDILEKRKTEVKERHTELTKEVAEERVEHEATLKSEFEERCDTIKVENVKASSSSQSGTKSQLLQVSSSSVGIVVEPAPTPNCVPEHVHNENSTSQLWEGSVKSEEQTEPTASDQMEK